MKVLKSTLEKLYEHLCQNPTFSGASSQEWLDTEDGQSETADFSGWKKEVRRRREDHRWLMRDFELEGGLSRNADIVSLRSR